MERYKNNRSYSNKSTEIDSDMAKVSDIDFADIESQNKPKIETQSDIMPDHKNIEEQEFDDKKSEDLNHNETYDHKKKNKQLPLKIFKSRLINGFTQGLNFSEKVCCFKRIIVSLILNIIILILLAGIIYSAYLKVQSNQTFNDYSYEGENLIPFQTLLLVEIILLLLYIYDSMNNQTMKYLDAQFSTQEAQNYIKTVKNTPITIYCQVQAYHWLSVKGIQQKYVSKQSSNEFKHKQQMDVTTDIRDSLRQMDFPIKLETSIKWKCGNEQSFKIWEQFSKILDDYVKDKDVHTTKEVQPKINGIEEKVLVVPKQYEKILSKKAFKKFSCLLLGGFYQAYFVFKVPTYKLNIRRRIKV